MVVTEVKHMSFLSCLHSNLQAATPSECNFNSLMAAAASELNRRGFRRVTTARKIMFQGWRARSKPAT